MEEGTLYNALQHDYIYSLYSNIFYSTFVPKHLVALDRSLFWGNSDHRGDHHCSESAFPAPDMLLAASERLRSGISR